MVVTELAYKFFSNEAYTIIPLQGHSGSFTEKPQETDPGILFVDEIKAYLPNINDENESLCIKLLYRRAIFRVTDSAGISYEVGDDIAKPTFTYEKINEGKPGSKHGYLLTISLKYSKPAKMLVL